MTRPEHDTTVELTVEGIAHGGAAVGRLPDGRACFVDYAIPGERVRARITDERRRWARATTVDVLEASPDRVEPPCPLFGPGRCGGCRLQHIAPARQAELLGTVIADQLQRIAHLDVPGDGTVTVLRPHQPDGLGYRNRARFVVTRAGRLAFRRARSHDPIDVDDCPLLERPARQLLARVASGWKGASEVQVRVGSDGHGAVTVTGRSATVPQDVPAAVHRSGGRTGRTDQPRVHYDVAGRRFVVSAGSFFQISVAAAELLVHLVRDFTAAPPDAHVVDCYAGVGLFAASLAADGVRVTAVEGSATACADALVNTGDLPVQVLQADVATGPAVARPVDAVVLDPPRAGAGPRVMAWVAGLEPARVTYVSCDPATFARDARALVDTGYRLVRIVGVDQFTHTGHVELVAAFERRTMEGEKEPQAVRRRGRSLAPPAAGPRGGRTEYRRRADR